MGTTNDIYEARKILKAFFGFSSFKGEQEEIIQNVMDDKNTFVVMPTGGGKSLCYQLPALMKEGTSIVVSPLIALMKNQVDMIRNFGTETGIAHVMNSSLSKAEIKQVRDDLTVGKTKLLYMAPESLTKEENVVFLKKIKVSFFAIDEAHCISEWGHDFRPEYRKLRSIINSINPNLPTIALTATATLKVQEDILKNLEISDADVYKASFDRENLYYEVRPKTKDVIKDIIKYIKTQPNKSGIVYCLSRKKVEEIAESLVVNGIRALPYHAGLDASTRRNNQDMFLMEEVEVIVATIAFGMGIDKPDIRFVIHHDIPKSIEGYYQETGRGGRDGREGNCITFYSYDDIQKLEKFMKDKPVAEQEIAKELLFETVAYAESSVCRHKLLLHYFGEGYTKESCGACDNCLNPKEKFEGKEHIILMLKTVLDLKEQFKIKIISEILAGKKSGDVKSIKLDKLPLFGAGKQHDEKYWVMVIRQGLIHKLVEKEIENYGIIKLTDKGKDYINNPYSILIAKDHDYEHNDDDDIILKGGGQRQSGADKVLFSLLKDLRKDISRNENLPPFVIFQDPSLEDMTIQYPISEDELQQISGVGAGKAAKYGKPFLDLISNYVEENEITRPNDMVIKSVVNKSGLKVYIIQSIDRKRPLDDIAHSKNLSLDAALKEIELIVSSGTKLDISYYIDEKVDEYHQEEIFDYFAEAETDSIQDALDELGEPEFSEEEVRLMRIKFLSEVGN
ncbi:MAG: DNA helicase RecQ [Lentimicrobiaceae bacterium]|jgi:ATP-dependent DNA helicase RecQ|nr:DNA helicase RecQ [Lentimicrobiaceae bacterium]MCP4911288.1 DNA helicase RecQ [Bacteroidota bacterium]MBT3454019.1 DNA helicase RecQ [Lentimicrobiaceae bacterium]MBT3819137.1 DNA helicase RecQ [Lentimicrobiaceae bacterium]MBT4060565.1 DNA helicase RecQ [Lentimicrobiaceae bacterium]